MKKLLFALSFVALFLIATIVVPPQSSNADELDDLNKKINELQQALDASKKASAPFESQLKNMQGELAQIENRVNSIEGELVQKRKSIDKGYEDLSDKQEVFDQTVRDYYIKSSFFSPLLIFVGTADASEVTKILAYQRRNVSEDKALITNIALTITDLEEKKKTLEDEEKRLSGVKTRLASEKQEVEKLVSGAKDYQANLTGEIAKLSAKQQEIINARSGGFTATIGDSELADDYNASIKGFREAAPSGSFAVFSFGAHTHRKGMSQYGARGRAAAGQDFKAILKAYYGKDPVSKDTGGSIKVSGYGEMDFETTYLYGIAEMPSSWNMEALKAQAVAARTYALRYKVDGREICTTEACQVFNKGKSDNAPASWKSAVDQTKGQVLEDVVTYYASTHGGFASPIGWDTTDGGGGGNFIDKSYDKAGGSPWVYKAWYTKAYSPSSDKCGRSSPWLSGAEMADIVNAAIALKTGGIDTSRITPTTTNCWGGNPYSMDELRDLVPGGISNATSVSVTQGNGTTNNVTINGVSLSGEDFKRAFNLRAPGYLSIPQSGFAFFNIEKK